MFRNAMHTTAPATQTPPRSLLEGHRRSHSDFLPALCFLLPNLLGFVLFTAGPLLFALGASFTNWDLQRAVPLAFIGVENFRSMVHNEEFWIYLINTGYLMLGLPVSIAGSLALALLLNRKLRGMTVYRTLFYLPAFTSGVALMILWKKLFNPEFGPINGAIAWVLGLFGADASALPTWLQSPQNLLALAPQRVDFNPALFGLGAREALIIMGVWLAIGGNNMLLYLAALTNVPPELYEAAEGTTTTLAYYIYIKAFQEFQMGYASAVAWALFAVIFAVTLVNWQFGSRAWND
jgi:multiple sugar transport system permease protein